MVCTLMLSRHLVIRFGGIGVTTPTVGDGTMAGDGIVLTTLGDITPVIGAAATGVAGMAADIGDIITITIPVTTRLQVDIIQTDVPLIEIIALMRVAEVPVIQVGGAVALLP